jgi:hypothetical protein
MIRADAVSASSMTGEVIRRLTRRLLRKLLSPSTWLLPTGMLLRCARSARELARDSLTGGAHSAGVFRAQHRGSVVAGRASRCRISHAVIRSTATPALANIARETGPRWCSSPLSVTPLTERTPALWWCGSTRRDGWCGQCLDPLCATQCW